MNFILQIFKLHLISIYFFVKLLFRQKKQVLFLSRQYDDIPLNYERIIIELKKEHIDYQIVCKKVDSGINDSLRTQGNYSTTNTLIKRVLKNIKAVLRYYFSLYKQMRLIASSKVIIVDGYNVTVSLLKHKRGTKVIQMWHALGAIKKFGYQSLGKKDGINPDVARILKMHNNYDFVLSGSIGMNQYFAEAFNTPIEKVLAIGTPTADYMRESNPQMKKDILKKYPQLKGKINILYSPTFRNDKSNNVLEIIKNFDFDKCNLIVALHPKVSNVINDDKVIFINRKDFSTSDVLKVVDYVITDYSAIMIEAALANKKILLYVYDYDKYDEENGINIPMLESYPHISNKNIKPLLNLTINDRYPYNEFQRFKNEFTPNIKDSTKEIMKLIKRCLDEKKIKKNSY